MNVPWLAMGTVYLLVAERTARRVLWGLVLFSGFAAGVLLSAPMETVHGTAIPVGKDVFGALPRILAAAGSGIAATVIIAGAVVSAVRFARDPSIPDHGRLAGANGLIALGTLVLSSGGLVQGAIGHDEAFTLSLAVGITIVYGGFVLASGRAASPRHLKSPGSGKISRRVIFGSSFRRGRRFWEHERPPGGSSTAPGPRVRVAWTSGSPSSTKPPSPPQAHPHSRPGQPLFSSLVRAMTPPVRRSLAGARSRPLARPCLAALAGGACPARQEVADVLAVRPSEIRARSSGRTGRGVAP